MSELEKQLREMKPHAQETLFAGWGVTPELKERLQERIEASGERVDALPTRPAWVRYGAVAVAAAGIIAVIGGQMGALPAPQDRSRPAPSPAPISAQMPAPAPATSAGGNTADKVIVSALTVDAYDAKGATVNFTSAQLENQSGSALTPPAPTGIPGVEAQPGQKIVLNAEYTLQVTDADATVGLLQQMTAAAHGYIVEASFNTGQDGSKAGRMVLRIPSASYTGAITQIRSLGKLRHERQWAQDVTEAYQDQERRTRILKEQEEKLQALSLKAATFEDWLKITNQINETRARIEQMEGQLKKLDNQIAYSTINLQIHQPAPGEAAVTGEPGGLASQMGQAFSRSLLSLRDFAWRIAVGIAGALPLLAPGALALGAGALALRRWRRRPAE